MDEVYERKAKYVDFIDNNGKLVTHLILSDMGRFSKKKSLDGRIIKYSTKNVNGKVITTVTYEEEL